MKQIVKPQIVGIIKERAVHLKLLHSFFIVKQVVEHGQCIRQNNDVQRAVNQVQPLLTNSVLSSVKLSYSVKLPLHKYAIIIIGITISLAGKPNMNAINITPSNPNNFANGSKKLEIWFNRLTSEIITLDNIHSIIPAGAATIIALPKTNRVLSNIERIITLPNCGFLYGGSSSVKKDGKPFRIVLDRIFDTINVIISPKIIIPDRYIAHMKLFKNEFESQFKQNIVINAINVGKRPLQGVKLFVNIAISLSLGESMILQPMIPAALHQTPIHVVRACLPHAPAFLNAQSK